MSDLLTMKSRGTRAAGVLLLLLGALCAAPAAYGAAPGDVIISFPSPGTAPTGLTFADGYLWCADEDTDTIYKLDPTDGSVLSSFSAPYSCPRGLAWDDSGYLWCADSCADRIYKINPSTGSVVSSFSSPGSTPRGLVFFDGYLRVSDSNSKLIYKVDPSTGSSVSTFSVANSYPRGLAWDGTNLWNIDGDAETVYRMDPDTGDVDLLVPTLCDFGYGLTWDGSYLWYADNEGAVIYKVRTDGSDLYALTKPRYFSLSFTQTSTSVLGYCTTNMAVPVDDLHQSITRDITYTPGGLPIATDQWGQDVARYSRWVYSDGSTVTYDVGAVTYNLRYFLDPDLCGTVADIPAGILADFTVDAEKYDITNSIITDAATEAVGSETNLYWIYRNIHDYVIDNISYEAAGGWDDAPTVLSRGNGSCSEYTYLFVAICRAAGLPARYRAGTRLRQDDVPYTDTVFHRWQEVYLPYYGGWVPVDCTHDDKAYPGARLQKFGGLRNTQLVTTTGGGDSDYLDWNYNSYDQWSFGSGSKSRSFYWYANAVATASSASSSGGSGDITVSYTLSDPEEDWTHIRVEFSENGGASWADATEGPGGDGTQQLAAAAGGTSHTFVWDSIADIGYTDQADLRIMITPYVEDDGTAAETADFSVDNLIDTDGDGLYDYDETGYGTDPADADSDDDGYSDAVEIAGGSDPLSGADTPSNVRICFQPDDASRSPAYALDAGSPFNAERGYGWD